MRFVTLGVVLSAALLTGAQAFAQHPIDVQRLQADADYMGSLAAYDRMPKRMATTDAMVSAAKSAWALGLSDRASAEFQSALQDNSLGVEARARINLFRSIIELQEERLQTAEAFVQRAMQKLDAPGALRAKIWMVWGDVLSGLQQFGAAAEKYKLSLAEAGDEDLPEVHFRLGECGIKLGQNEAAKEQFENVPLDNDRAPEAIRYLAQLALDQGEYQHAQFWLNRGRTDFPERFLDSWVDYALLQAALHQGDRTAAKNLMEAANTQYPPSDFWLSMLNATFQASSWRDADEILKKGAQ
ncbi:MAG: hypothetical protein K1X83_03860 [Oligoflexia bacterium]|nr:hypothetical protein [Oligoflexia bacterium]